jgi:hypothetical protein
MEANLDDFAKLEDSGGYHGGLAVNSDDQKAEPKKRHVFIHLTNGDIYPFLIKPDAKEEKMYCCLVISKPFVTAKYKGVTKA